MSANIGRVKPRKQSLIANLLNRVDGKSLAVKKAKTSGIVYYLESVNQKHLKANKESLNVLNYEELEILLSGMELARPTFTSAMFALEQHIPERQREPQEKKSYIVKSIKQTDRQGSDKFVGDDKNTKNTNNTKKSFNKPKRKRI